MKTSLMLLLLVVSAGALDDMSFSNTYTAGEVLTHTKLNQDNDSTRLPYNRLLDSLDAKFIRFTDTTDMVFDTIECDRIGVGRAPTAAGDFYSASGNLIVYMTAAGADDAASNNVVADGGNIALEMNGTTESGTRFGVNRADAAFLVGSNVTAMGIGPAAVAPLTLGTGNAARLTIDGNGDSLTLTNIDTVHGTSTVARFNFLHADSGVSVDGSLISGAQISIGNNNTNTSTATPHAMNLGGTYANTGGDVDKAKLYIYDDGSNQSGFGLSGTAMEAFAHQNVVHLYGSGGRRLIEIGANGTATSLNLIGNQGGPAYITLDADSSDDAADHWRIRSDHTTNQLQFQNNTTNKVTFDPDGDVSMRKLTIGSGTEIDSVALIDGAADTLVFKIGGKAFKFLPVANL